MASPGSDAGRHLSLQPLHHHYHHTEPAPEPAVREAQRWIEAVTGRSFGDKDFRGGLDNGILLCELLSSIKPGLVKKINRLPTAVAALDNVSLFRKGCEELGLKGSQLFDPGDLQDTATCTNKGPDSNKKIKNVLITIYWLGRAANSSATYNGPTLDLHEFEGLLSQMRKEAEEWDSPKRSIRDSGYIDSWESERSDSFSPPRHARDDSFDSLDSIGSRSRHTPSPDGLLARGYSDGHGSDSESDAPQRKMPDVRKDDMLVRRTSCNEPRTAVPFNQYLPNKSNQSSFIPMPARHLRADREDNRKSWSNATSPVGGERPFSGIDSLSSEESCKKCVVTGNDVHYIDLEPVDTDTHPKKTIVLPQNELPSSDPESNNPQLSDPQTRSPSLSKNHLHPSVPPHPQEQSHSDCKKMEKEEMERDGQVTVNQTSQNISDSLQSDVEMFHNQTAGNDARFSRSSSVFDDPESVSMFDMRSDEDSMLPPHCQVRHELMHNQYNRMKEEEDHWQDDLARWKSRRRSVSQDLIKKEEERKMVERLLSGDEGSQRRKSIKTYREIVEEKERRERELHEAYQNARTPEEAAAVLQRYAQRFTISEAVLERIKLPKLLERSVSANPTCLDSLPTSLDISAFSSTSNPLQYLRQQSLPVPKFTSMVEARVTGYNLEQGIMRDTEGISGPVRSHVTAPSLGPKQNRQSRSGNTGKRTAKVDEMTQVNGERKDDICGIEEEEQPQRDREEEEHYLQFFPSPSQHTEIIQTDVSGVQPMDTLSSTHTPKPDRWEEDREMTEMDKRGTIPLVGDAPMSPKVLEPKTDETVADQGQFSEDQTCMITDPTEVNQSESVQDVIQSGTSDTQVNTQANESMQKSSNHSAASIISSFRTTPVGGAPITDMAEKDGNVPPTVLNLVNRGEHFSWSHEEECKRQERWQREQERMLQDKYQREQEKLKHEWEQAQKEVEEEERRYHEEEGTILKETVTSLTPHSPIAPSALPNTHSTLHTQWEPAEKQMMSENFRQRQNGIREAAQNNTECLQMTASSPLQSCGSMGQSYGQRGPDVSQEKQPTLQRSQGESDVPKGNRQQQQQNETLKKNTSQTKPGGRRRSDSLENIGPNSTTSTSFTDTQPPPSPNRSVSGKKLCSSCGHPLGKGAAMIIETLSLYFHIQCFKCGICKGQLGDTSTGTDVRIRNGLLNCNQCYIRSRSAGQPTTL
ncbi:LIM and calponin homology domains-containing protein 1-like isoform X1 [Myxocyprinus asiaticus]|uniref:LIM and calponin homology domains-containing protein 1-like isoform X1 n=1 Tax=Myxocyprinus asiaticus TaxID=70543 RepID=UPI0022233C05|nr:LIM and calponin homology domains-containing protein 1-like isoform X1 [Myxocyprinus asiaticus]